MDRLRKDLDHLTELQARNSVEAALRRLRELLTRPQALFDPHATFAALEHLADVARERGSDQASRYSIIQRQTRPLLSSPSLQALLLKLVGSPEEVAIAKEIPIGALKVNQNPAPPLMDNTQPSFQPYSRRPSSSLFLFYSDEGLTSETSVSIFLLYGV